MRIVIEVQDTTTMMMVNAMYRSGDDLRLVSACVTDPGDTELVELEGSDKCEVTQ